MIKGMLTRFAIQPMTIERIERMYPPIGVCEICKQPESIKVTYGGTKGLILNLLARPRYACRDHLQQVIVRMCKV